MKVVLLSLMLLLAFIAIDCSPLAEEESPLEEEGEAVEAAKRQDTVEYTVIVETGNAKHAGTNARVFIQLIGPLSASQETILDNKLRDDFEKGHTDKFRIYAGDVGDILKIRIRHDNSGKHSGWYLNKVTVIDNSRNRWYVFPCYQWLASDEGDGQISRELYPS